jgi:hypothetical protein
MLHNRPLHNKALLSAYLAAQHQRLLRPRLVGCWAR